MREFFRATPAAWQANPVIGMYSRLKMKAKLSKLKPQINKIKIFTIKYFYFFNLNAIKCKSTKEM